MHTAPPPLDDILRTLPSSPAGTSPLAVFDCDDTLVHGDTGEAMFYHQVEHFLLRVSPADVWTDHPARADLDTRYRTLRALTPAQRAAHAEFLPFADMMLERYFHQLRRGHTAKACGDIVRLWSGWNEEEVRSIAREVLLRELTAPQGRRRLGSRDLPCGLRFLAEPVVLLRNLERRGFTVLIISGSNRWIVEAVADRIGVSRSAVLGIGLTRKGELLTPEFDGPVTVLEGKIEALRRRTAERPVLVCSDSAYDLPLFEYSAGMRVLVRARDGADLFTTGAAVRDERWAVIEAPTLTGAV